MQCPACGGVRLAAQETRRLDDVTYRRRRCAGCKKDHWTAERVIDRMPVGLHSKSEGFHDRHAAPKGVQSGPRNPVNFDALIAAWK